MAIDTFVRMLPGLGLIGLFVSVSAYVTTKLSNGIAKNLTKLAQRIAIATGVVIILLLLAGYGPSPSDFLLSLANVFRGRGSISPR